MRPVENGLHNVMTVRVQYIWSGCEHRPGKHLRLAIVAFSLLVSFRAEASVLLILASVKKIYNFKLSIRDGGLRIICNTPSG